MWFHAGVGHIHDDDSGLPRNGEDKVNSKQMIQAMLAYVWPKVNMNWIFQYQFAHLRKMT